MSKYRLKFKKEGPIKFIGHLDLLKLFQKAIKRAGIPIKYSQGYNPHQKVSFAIPLSLGMESLCEYVDIELTADMNNDQLVKSLNAVMPDGLEFIEGDKMPEGYKGSAAELRRASYIVTANNIPVDIEKIISDMMKEEAIVVRKKSKRKEEDINIRQDIFDLKAEEGHIMMTISTGSVKHLKPEYVINHIFSIVDTPPEGIKYKRTDLVMGE